MLAEPGVALTHRIAELIYLICGWVSRSPRARNFYWRWKREADSITKRFVLLSMRQGPFLDE